MITAAQEHIHDLLCAIYPNLRNIWSSLSSLKIFLILDAWIVIIAGGCEQPQDGLGKHF